jgi:hypothetical protein
MKTNIAFTLLTMMAASLSWAGELDTLRESYEREKARLVKPLDEKLRKELEALKVSFVKQSQLDEAAKVDAALKERFPLPVISSSKAPYKFGPSVWELSGKRMQFREDGLFSYEAWDRRGTWKQTRENVVEVTRSNGRKARFEVTVNPDGSILGRWKEPNVLDKVVYPVRP